MIAKKAIAWSLKKNLPSVRWLIILACHIPILKISFYVYRDILWNLHN